MERKGNVSLQKTREKEIRSSRFFPSYPVNPRKLRFPARSMRAINRGSRVRLITPRIRRWRGGGGEIGVLPTRAFTRGFHFDITASMKTKAKSGDTFSFGKKR